MNAWRIGLLAGALLLFMAISTQADDPRIGGEQRLKWTCELGCEVDYDHGHHACVSLLDMCLYGCQQDPANPYFWTCRSGCYSSYWYCLDELADDFYVCMDDCEDESLDPDFGPIEPDFSN